jgi:opacity protein-like surface antigen
MASGFAEFQSGNFRQDLEVNAHVVSLNIGYSHNITEKFFLEGSVGAGIALTNTKGRQGANLDINNYFPDESDTGLSFNGALTGGYRITDNVALTFTGDFIHIGGVKTGTTDGTEGCCINAGERLSADLNVVRAMVGLRIEF